MTNMQNFDWEECERDSSQYILFCGRKVIKHWHAYLKNCYDDTQTSEQKMLYNNLCSHFSKAAEIGVEFVEKYNFLIKYVDEVT